MNITLIVCRLIVVTIQVWESDFSLRKSSVWLLIAKAPRRARILARGIGRTGRAAPELRGWGGARGAERSPGEHHQAGSCAVCISKGTLHKLSIAACWSCSGSPFSTTQERDATGGVARCDGRKSSSCAASQSNRWYSIHKSRVADAIQSCSNQGGCRSKSGTKGDGVGSACMKDQIPLAIEPCQGILDVVFDGRESWLRCR